MNTKSSVISVGGVVGIAVGDYEPLAPLVIPLVINPLIKQVYFYMATVRLRAIDNVSAAAIPLAYSIWLTAADEIMRGEVNPLMVGAAAITLNQVLFEGNQYLSQFYLNKGLGFDTINLSVNANLFAAAANALMIQCQASFYYYYESQFDR